MNDKTYWSWLQEQTAVNEAESAAFSESSSVLLLEPEIELEPPVPNGFESFWK
jgi:hypothetical protein